MSILSDANGDWKDENTQLTSWKGLDKEKEVNPSMQSAERFASAWSFILQASSSGPPDEILIILASLALVGQIILILFDFLQKHMLIS